MRKSILKTKTFWTGFASFVGGVYMIVTGDTDSGVQLISTGLAAIFLRDSIRKI